nr:hypothetical protein [Tanacetum cinerariifolium]
MLRELKTLFAQQAEKELLQTTRDFHSCRQEEGQLVSSYVLKMKGYIDNLERHPVTIGLGLHEQTLPKNNAPALNAIRAGKVQKGHWKRNCPQYLAELLKKKKNAASGAGGSGSKGNKKRIEKLQHDGLLDSSDLRAFQKCVSCMSGKMARKPYTHQVERAKDLLGLIYTDHKHEVFETFKVFQKEVENQLGKTIKSLRSDREGEYMIQEFLDHLKDHGVIAHRTPPHTPQHNGVLERRNRTLLEMVEMTPYEVWHGKAPKLSYLQVWGCEVLVKRDTLTKRDKLEPRSIKCIFVGYLKETIRYSFYYPPENKVLVARNAEFLENSLINQEASESLEYLEIVQEEDTHPSIDTSLNHEEDDLEIDEPQSDIIPIRRSTRIRHAPDRMCLYIDADEHELGDLELTVKLYC